MQVNYRDKSSQSLLYLPLKNAHIEYQIGSAGTVTEQTNDQGIVTIPCQAGNNNYGVQIYNKNDDVKVFDGPHGSSYNTFAVSITGSLGSDCGHTIVVNSQNSYLFAAMNQVIANSRSFFQKSRGQISVYRKFSGDVSGYNHDDYISILDSNDGNNAIGSDYGNFGLAHEYGHALQNKALGGIPSYNCSVHYISGAYNLGCAYGEGFADYHATVTSTNLSPYFSIESNTTYHLNFSYQPYYLGCLNFQNNICTDLASNPDGPIVEGAVAAFLYDLTDPANESFDNADYPGSYVADIVQDCQVDGDAANGIDHLIACFQHGIPDYLNHFPMRNNIPSTYSESVTEPPGWNKTDIKKLWYKDLYGENYTPPPPPVDVTLSGPTSLLTVQSGTWTASASGGTGSYSYDWSYRQRCTNLCTWGPWNTLVETSNQLTRSFGNAQQESREVQLKVTAGSGGVGDTDILTINVVYPSGSGLTADSLSEDSTAGPSSLQLLKKNHP